MKSLLLMVTAAVALALSDWEEETTRTLEKQFPTQPNQHIEIIGFSGSDIKFQSWEKNEVYIKLSVYLESSDKEYERRYIEGVSLIDSQTPQGLRISLSEPKSISNSNSFFGVIKKIFGGSYQRKEVIGEVYVPQSNPLTTDLRYGSFALENMKGSLRLLGTSNTLTLRNCSALENIENDYGKTTIENSSGTLTLSGKSSRITIEDFKGGITMNADYSTIVVKNVSQSMAIQSKSATIKVDDVQGSLTVDSDYSTITANKIAGMLHIENLSGKVRAKSVDGLYVDANYTSVDVSSVSGKASKEIYIRGQSGALSLEDAIGNVKIINPYSSMELKNIRGNIELSSKSSRIVGEDIIGDWNSMTEYSSFYLRGITASKVVMINKSNTIDVQLKAAPTHLEIKNEYAGVNVTMPQGFSGEVDLNATYGRIDTNFPLEKTKSFRGAGAYAIGKMGNGSGKINIETTSANIKLMQR